MAKEVTPQVRKDLKLKEQTELSKAPTKRTLGIANGKYSIPNDIDGSNDEIAEMFGAE